MGRFAVGTADAVNWARLQKHPLAKAHQQSKTPIIQFTLPKNGSAERKVRDVLEQGETVDTVTILDAEYLLKLRFSYFKNMGGELPEFARPSDSQLSALKQKLDGVHAPYTVLVFWW